MIFFLSLDGQLSNILMNSSVRRSRRPMLAAGSTYEYQCLLFEIIDQGKIRVFENYFILSLNLLSHYLMSRGTDMPSRFDERVTC